MPVDEAIVDGDTGFVGVNSRLDPSQLQQGFVASAINKRFVNGVAETRAGIKKMPWSNRQPSYDNSVQYNSGDYVLYSGRKVTFSSASNAQSSTEPSLATHLQVNQQTAQKQLQPQVAQQVTRLARTLKLHKLLMPEQSL